MNYIDKSDFPGSLLLHKDCPKRLYYAGDITLLNEDIVLIVGKRETTKDCLESAYTFGKEAANEGFVISNGFAVGCDTYALLGSLDANGKVIIVMPCGVDVIYPPNNTLLYERIINTGGLIISEYPNGTLPEKYMFVRRDRIEAMISNKVVIVDCDDKGGTYKTAKMARKYGKLMGCYRPENAAEGIVTLCNDGVYEIKSIEDYHTFLKQENRQLTLFD